MKDWTSVEDVAAWVAEYGREMLERNIDAPRFSGQNLSLAREYREMLRRDDAVKESERRRDIEERMTKASESAASAAKDSARFAGDSAKWARWAAIISLAALAVAAYPLIK
jgi:hypothetical protein